MNRKTSRLRSAVAIATCLRFLRATPLHAATDPSTSELAPPAAIDPLSCDGGDAGSTAPSDDQTAGADKPKKGWKTGQLFVKDAGHVLSAPGWWTKKQWSEFGIAAAAVVGTAFLDTTIRDAVQRNRGGPVESITNRLEPFGAEYSFVVIAGFYIGGVSAHDKNARETAVDAIAGTLIASGIITPVLKKVVGRARPSASGGDPTQFEPFSNNPSFPSGHATQAFVVASVIASHYDQKWVQGLSYGIASSVALARVIHDQHWASDVVAGSLIGASVGKEIVRFNGKERAPGAARYSIVPRIDRRGYGGALAVSF